jgi:hypothetical protein
MVFTRKQKQILIAASNPLREASILQQELSILPGNRLCLGGVCREWEALCAGIADQQVRTFRLDCNSKLVTFGSNSTLYSAAVAPPATARLAHSCGLAISKNEQLQVIAGAYADTLTLAALRELGMPLSERVVNAAAQSGRLGILQHLLLDRRCPVPSELSYYAARSGSVNMLRWLRARTMCELDYSTCQGAASAGHLAALKYLRRKRCEWDNDNVACVAARGGSIEVIEWLRHCRGIEIGYFELQEAAFAGQFAMCKHLRSTGCEWDAETCARAVAGGHADILRWLRENGCPWNVNEVCMEAAYYGFTDILDIIIEQGEVLHAELLTNALKCAGASNKLLAAQWLSHRGAEWPAELCMYGEYKIDLWSGDTLARARAEGCTSPFSIYDTDDDYYLDSEGEDAT